MRLHFLLFRRPPAPPCVYYCTVLQSLGLSVIQSVAIEPDDLVAPARSFPVWGGGRGLGEGRLYSLSCASLPRVQALRQRVPTAVLEP